MRAGAALIVVGACSGPATTPPTAPPSSARTLPPISAAADAAMIAIPAGAYLAGSTRDERDAAYGAYAATAGTDTARVHGWFEREQPRHTATLPAFRIDATPVTNAAYAELVAAGGAAPPSITADAWAAQHVQQDYATQVARYVWTGAGRSGAPPAGRADHPVVLVTWVEASAYCAWRGRRLPTADEYEKAARGSDGRAYPWGDAFDAARLDSAVAGPRDTLPVGSFRGGASPYGVLDAAGNVFEWTATPWPQRAGDYTVKGSAWDDFAGVGRGASAHGRPAGIHHAIVGFRCAGEP